MTTNLYRVSCAYPYADGERLTSTTVLASSDDAVLRMLQDPDSDLTRGLVRRTLVPVTAEQLDVRRVVLLRNGCTH